MNTKAAYAIVMTIVGCMLNNVFLEYIVRLDPGSGHLITFCQFLFIAVHGFIFTSKFGTVQPQIPLKDYLILVSMFFVTSIVNNWAFNFNIPVPLHMIFRAGSLIANMIMGILILKKRYTFSKFLSVAMITTGIVICTLISHNMEKKGCSDCSDALPEKKESQEDHLFWWFIGIILLTFALLLSARMGIFQESISKRYGKHPGESLYYTHLYSMPPFLFYASSIWSHAVIAFQSEPYVVPVFDLAIPLLVIYLILNVITQFMCISSVYVLTTECSSLTVTLVLTLRKFLSLILSIVYFKNPFTLGHWFGTLLVFTGTIIFTEVPQRIQESLSAKPKQN